MLISKPMELKTVGIEQLHLSVRRTDRSVPSVMPALMDAARGDATGLPIVRSIGDRRYEILQGAEIWLAVQAVGRRELAVVIRDDLDEEAAFALLERDGRTDPITYAESLRDALESMTAPGTRRNVSALARRLNLSRSSVAHALRLLGLPEDVARFVRQGRLEAGHANVLLSVKDVARQRELAKKAAGEGWSVRELQKAARGRPDVARTATPSPTNGERLPAESSDPDLRALEQRLSAVVGAPLRIDADARRMIVAYSDTDELEGIIDLIERGGEARSGRVREELPW